MKITFQPICLLCERPAFKKGLCCYCDPIAPLVGSLCKRCGMALSQTVALCGNCEGHAPGPIKAVRSALWLTDEAKKIIHLIKFQGRYEWLDLFKEAVHSSVLPWSLDSSTIVPVPLHYKRFLHRGFNQAEILAHWLSAQSPLSRVECGLEKLSYTPPQSTLGKGERRSNLVKSFGWNRKIPIPSEITLVDDVYTTGETLRHCATLLKQQGAKQIYAWTLFRTPYRID